MHYSYFIRYTKSTGEVGASIAYPSELHRVIKTLLRKGYTITGIEFYLD